MLRTYLESVTDFRYIQKYYTQEIVNSLGNERKNR